MSWQRDHGAVRFVGPPGWRQIPLVTKLSLILPTIGYLAFVFRAPGIGTLVAVPERVYPKLELWRLLTFPVVVGDIVTLLFGLLLFWMIGTELERTWGSRRFALFLGLAALLSASLAVGATLLLREVSIRPIAFAGFSAVLTSLIVAWALLDPRQSLSYFGVLPMTRRTFGIIAVVIGVFSELQYRLAVSQVLFAVGGLPIAWLFSRDRRSGLRIPLPRLLRRRRFRVVRGGGGGDDYRIH